MMENALPAKTITACQDSHSLPRQSQPAKTITALFPLFREHANTPAMIHHAMLLIKRQTTFLNPGK
jgi:hypothetical protein